MSRETDVSTGSLTHSLFGVGVEERVESKDKRSRRRGGENEEEGVEGSEEQREKREECDQLALFCKKDLKGKKERKKERKKDKIKKAILSVFFFLCL